MDSESARMSSAAEAKFRIDRAEFAAARRQGDRARRAERAHRQGPGGFAVAARDLPDGFGILRRAARRASRFSMGGWLNDLAGRTKNLIDEVETADLVVMVASAGENAARGGHHRRSLQRQARHDDGAHPRRRIVERRNPVKDARALRPACHDARDFERRRIYQGHAHGVARLIVIFPREQGIHGA